MSEVNDQIHSDPTQSFSVYAAGEMFDLHDLATNVMLKAAIGEVSGGKYDLLLPQSKEPRTIDHPNQAAHIRNLDLRNVMRSDLVLVRFDGMLLLPMLLLGHLAMRLIEEPSGKSSPVWKAFYQAAFPSFLVGFAYYAVFSTPYLLARPYLKSLSILVIATSILALAVKPKVANRVGPYLRDPWFLLT